MTHPSDETAFAGLPSLPAAFYTRPTIRVARALLGKILVHESREGMTAGRIVEVEAYCGPKDRAAHSAGGRRTRRNEVMWGPAGRLYVYFTYGMHHCGNVVTRRRECPEAILLRALEPLAGIDLMLQRRGRPLPPTALARGPGNLCLAMGIDRTMNGADLTGGSIRIVDSPNVPAARVATSPRIGVAYAGADAFLPWRFFVRDSDAVSGRRPRREARRTGILTGAQRSRTIAPRRALPGNPSPMPTGS